jgi:hypothetical protein
VSSQRVVKPASSPDKAKETPAQRSGGGGRDRRTAKEYAADLARETARSLARDPERWTRKRTNQVPKDRTIESDDPE